MKQTLVLSESNYSVILVKLEHIELKENHLKTLRESGGLFISSHKHLTLFLYFECTMECTSIGISRFKSMIT